MLDEVVSVEVVRHFCDVATQRLGVSFDDRTQALVAGRVAKRLQILQIPLEEYLRRISDDADCQEAVGFLDFVRPRAQRFFASPEDHDDLRGHMVWRLGIGQRRFRLWSAGCGSGEEPYGMLMTALLAIEDVGLSREQVDLKVLATDISPRALELGKRGSFDEAQLRDVPARLRDRFFLDTGEGALFHEQAKNLVYFRRLNLSSPPFPMNGPLDAIFCHEGLHVLVPAARTRAAEAARTLLSPSGVFRTGFDLRSGEDWTSEEESLWLDGLRGLVRPTGNC